jgi:hypothetical protein
VPGLTLVVVPGAVGCSQIQGLPTMIFIGTTPDKPALRTEGLLPAETIKNIIAKEL